MLVLDPGTHVHISRLGATDGSRSRLSRNGRRFWCPERCQSAAAPLRMGGTTVGGNASRSGLCGSKVIRRSSKGVFAVVAAALIAACGEAGGSGSQLRGQTSEPVSACSAVGDTRPASDAAQDCVDLRIGSLTTLDPANPLHSIGFVVGTPSWCELEALIAAGADRYVQCGAAHKVQAIRMLARNPEAGLRAWAVLEEISEHADRERWTILHAYHSELAPLVKEVRTKPEATRQAAAAVWRKYARLLQESTRRFKREVSRIDLGSDMPNDEFNRVIWPLLELH